MKLAPFTREEKRHGVGKPLVLSHPVNNWRLRGRELSSEAKYWTPLQSLTVEQAQMGRALNPWGT